MELVIEVMNRGSRLHDRQPVRGDSISIGRAFDNDVILKDPHICAHHAKIEIDDSGELTVRDLSSVNGITDLKHHAVTGSSTFQSGDEFILGKTHIRIFKKDHAVEPAIKLTSFEKVLNILGKPAISVGLVLFVFAISLMSIYMNTAHDIKWAERTIIVIVVELLFIIWALLWSTIARVKKQDMRFFTQVSVVMLFSLSLFMLEILFNWVGFHVGDRLIVEVTSQAFVALLLFMLIWLNLYLSLFQASLKRLVPALILAALFFGLKYLVFDMESEDFKAFANDYSGSLYPPSVTVYSTMDTKTFIDSSAFIFESPDPVEN